MPPSGVISKSKTIARVFVCAYTPGGKVKAWCASIEAEGDGFFVSALPPGPRKCEVQPRASTAAAGLPPQEYCSDGGSMPAGAPSETSDLVGLGKSALRAAAAFCHLAGARILRSPWILDRRGGGSSYEGRDNTVP